MEKDKDKTQLVEWLPNLQKAVGSILRTWYKQVQWHTPVILGF